MIEYFEGMYFYQLVMYKHGRGMDLFEFIELCPCIDEPLASSIFRQVTSLSVYCTCVLLFISFSTLSVILYSLSRALFTRAVCIHWALQYIRVVGILPLQTGPLVYANVYTSD